MIVDESIFSSVVVLVVVSAAAAAVLSLASQSSKTAYSEKASVRQ